MRPRSFAVMALVVAACGDDAVHHLPDAPRVDAAAIDVAPAIDAAVPNLVVATRARCCGDAPGSPLAGAAVFATNPGASASAATSDAAGDAAFAGIVANASVMVVAPAAGSVTEVFTIAGVQPGDHLAIGDGYYAPDTHGAAGTMTIAWPAVAGADNYFIVSPCMLGSYVVAPATTLSVPLYPFCQSATAPISFVAYAMTGPAAIVASGRIAAAPYVDGATATLPAWTAQTAEDFTVSVSGVPADVATVDLAAHLYEPPVVGMTYELIGRVAITGGAATRALELPAASAAVAGALPSGIAVFGKTGTAARQMFEQGGGSPLAIAASASLPWVDGVAVTANNAALTWSITGGSATGYDAVVAHVAWTRANPAGAADTFTWTAVLPPGTTSLPLTTTDAALAPFQPTAGATINAARVDLVDLSSVTTYAAARALPIWRVAHATDAVHVGDEPAAAIALAPFGDPAISFKH